jgi:hypothetical protein
MSRAGEVSLLISVIVQIFGYTSHNGAQMPDVLRKASRSLPALAVCIVALFVSANAKASPTCPDEQETPQVPSNPALCAELNHVVRNPSALPLDEYEAKLGEYLRNFCHRDLGGGWKVDKYLRNTGPYVATYRNGSWSGASLGTHSPVLVWYSPELYEWLKTNRADSAASAANEAAVPDGAIIVKEMYPVPAAACRGIDWQKLRPMSQGAVVMVRDSKASYDGWFWAWFGWGADWMIDWPKHAEARDYPSMGFGLYCTNCHASAKANATFSALRNILGEAGQPYVFLSQNFFLDPSWQSLHTRIAQAVATAAEPAVPERPYNSDFRKSFAIPGGPPEKVVPMPSETYDHVWAKAGERSADNQFLTSDQCLGCHSAGGTGLQFDMTEPGTDDKLINVSPYGTWRGSPMALSGRDPIFLAQLASESHVFHPQSTASVENTCLSCHGVAGQRQFSYDRKAKTGRCKPLRRETLDAVPYPHDAKLAGLSNYGALARDGVSCVACHEMALGALDRAKAATEPQNSCILERQESFNIGLTGLAKTFTGNFFAGPPSQINGPFSGPKEKPMKAAIGITPVHKETVSGSEMCASCHTIHLPVLRGDQTIGHSYEQTTYPEWAFSGYRTGKTADGTLPLGAGAQPRSCQDCHMPDKDPAGAPYRSKIAAIQEYSNFPQADDTLPPQDIDLPERSGVAKHTLLGLNLGLLQMAQQFADVLGIRLEDPMLLDSGIDPISSAERQMLDQAADRTASVSVSDVRTQGDVLDARVTVINKTGHKFPSGVAFRRAFIEFKVLDSGGNIVWASGRTNKVGVIVDQNDRPIEGELWWKRDCSERIAPLARLHQPHYQVISRQDEAQIYEELVSAPPDGEAPSCGAHASPAGPLTTSFLSSCARVKDNRLLPHGFLAMTDRTEIAQALGAGPELAEEVEPVGVADDADYRTSGGDSLHYRVPLAELKGRASAVQATLYYQATPPYYLQDRFCTSGGEDTRRLYYVAGKLQLDGTSAESWKLRVVTSGPVAIP